MAATSPILWELDARTAARSEPRMELHDLHFPLLFVLWSGDAQPQQVLQLIRFTDAAHERARQEGVQLLTICDAREALRPSDLVRDMLVDWLSDETVRASGLGLGSIIVTRDPIVRGVIASIKWATGRATDELEVVPEPELAIERARLRLLAHGLPIPDVLEQG